MKWYWISFGSTLGNLGCCNVQAENIQAAIIKTHILKINPGGEAMVVEIPEPELEPDRLYSKEELYAMDYRSLTEEAKHRGVDPDDLPADYVCEHCNTINCNQHN